MVIHFSVRTFLQWRIQKWWRVLKVVVELLNQEDLLKVHLRIEIKRNRSGGPNFQSQFGVKCFRCDRPCVIRSCSQPMPNITCNRCRRYDHATKDH